MDAVKAAQYRERVGAGGPLHNHSGAGKHLLEERQLLPQRPELQADVRCLTCGPTASALTAEAARDQTCLITLADSAVQRGLHCIKISREDVSVSDKSASSTWLCRMTAAASRNPS